MDEFHRDILTIDAEHEVDRIVQFIRDSVFDALTRRGAVVGVSGGVDSAVALALAARALSPAKVVAILLPEMESSSESKSLARQVCRQVGVTPIVEDVTAPLLGFGCYRRRDELVRSIFPDYDATYTLKISLPSDLLDRGTFNVFSLTIISPEGDVQAARLSADVFQGIVAATNFKQRTRAAMLYHYAERHQFAVIGTPPKDEHALGFFVKYGDGAMDLMPLVHLYKTQIYQLAEYLDICEAIRSRPPTTDTYSATCSQQEFFFRLPFATLDLLHYAWEHEVPIATVSRELDLTEEQVARAFRDFRGKVRATHYLRTNPMRIGQ